MSDKNPQPTTVLIARLRRVGRALDGLAAGDDYARDPVTWKAFANTCLQAAGRLEDFQKTGADDARPSGDGAPVEVEIASPDLQNSSTRSDHFGTTMPETTQRRSR